MGKDRHSQSAPKIEFGSFSIQWLEGNPAPCVLCSSDVGPGPVGFQNNDPAGPVCDACLLESHSELGMLLTMIHVNRELALQTDDPHLADQKMVTLMTISKIYDQGAKWPARSVPAMEIMNGLLERIAKVPLASLLKMLTGPAH